MSIEAIQQRLADRRAERRELRQRLDQAVEDMASRAAGSAFLCTGIVAESVSDFWTLKLAIEILDLAIAKLEEQLRHAEALARIPRDHVPESESMVNRLARLGHRREQLPR
jgi:hypothetical protein